MKNILIGTMCVANETTPQYIRELGKLGFESTEITFGRDCSWLMGLKDPMGFAEECRKAVVESGMVLSSVGIYGNPLESDEASLKCRESWSYLIEHCYAFGTDMVSGFTGRLTNKSIPDNIPQYKVFWGDLSAKAKELGVRIVFENCNMGGNWNYGTWNIAFNSAAFELMFEALPADNIGIEWEPAHALCQLINPVQQLEDWGHKIFHVHGKDANVNHAGIARYGVNSNRYLGAHRFPGLGDCNWAQLISILRSKGYCGNIDIEGWRDKVYRGDLEMTGQVMAMNHLKNARGGKLVQNI